MDDGAATSGDAGANDDDAFATAYATHNEGNAWDAHYERWPLGDQHVTMQFWHRPLRAMVAAFQGAGFELARIDEPHPRAEAESLFPDAFRRLSTKPRFLFFVLRRP